MLQDIRCRTPACAGKLKDDMDRLSAAAPSTRINIVPPEDLDVVFKEPDSNPLRKLIRQIFNRRARQSYRRNPLGQRLWSERKWQPRLGRRDAEFGALPE